MDIDKETIERREKDLDDILISSGVPATQLVDLKEKIKRSDVFNCKSEAMFRYSVMIQLLFDGFAKDLDILFVIGDPDTHETVNFMHASGHPDDESKTIDDLIKHVTNACFGTREENGETVASSLMTVIGNVAAMYCAKKDEQFESFKNVVDYWKRALEDKETGKDDRDD